MVLAAVVAATPRAAFAQAAPQEDPRISQSRAHFNSGQKLVQQGKYTEAYAEFHKGYELSHRPLFLFNMAECARQGGDSARARDGYERYLREDPLGAQATKARERLADLGPGGLRIADPKARPSGTPPEQTPAATKPAATKLAVTKPAVTKKEPVPGLSSPAVPAAEAGPALIRQPTPQTAVGEEPRPFHRRWGVWAVVGAAVVGGVALGMVLASGGNAVPKTPLGAQRAFGP